MPDNLKTAVTKHTRDQRKCFGDKENITVLYLFYYFGFRVINRKMLGQDYFSISK